MTGAELRRTLSLGDAVAVGLSAMVGAGVFVAFGPAAAAARSALVTGLNVAGVERSVAAGSVVVAGALAYGLTRSNSPIGTGP